MPLYYVGFLSGIWLIQAVLFPAQLTLPGPGKIGQEIPVGWSGGGEGCNTSFIRRIGDEGLDEECFFMAFGPDSNYYLAGRQADRSILLLLDEEGNILDKRGFDFTAGNDFIANFIVDSDGFIVGSARDQLNAATVNVLFKYDWTNNVMVWSQQISDPAYIRIEGVYENPANSNYIFYGMATGSLDEYIVEAERSTGNIQEQFLSDHGGNTDVLQRHYVTPEAVYFAGVGRLGFNLSDIRPTLSKFDTAGNLLWTKIHLRSAIQPSRLYNMDLVVEGDTIANLGRGSLSDSDLSNSVLLFYKTSLDGGLYWAKRYDVTSGSEVWASKLLTVPGGYIVQGAYLDDSLRARLFFARFSNNGSVLWAKQINTTVEMTGITRPLFLINGDFIVFATQTQPGNNSSHDLLFGQIRLDGNIDHAGCDLIEDLSLVASAIENPFEGNIFSAVSHPDYNYSGASPAFSAPELAVLDLPGCACATEAEQVVEFPNVFSPNGDGINDTFYPIGKGAGEIIFLRVFSRWGEAVFERNNFPAGNPSLGWDGSFKGKPAVSDVYIFQAKLMMPDGTEKIFGGDVTLLR